MAEKEIKKLVIIGSGPAGLTAGIYAARADMHPLIIDGTKPGGQLMGTSQVENWPGEQSILGPTLMQKMRDHAQHLGSEFLSGEIVKVDFTKKPFTLWTNKDTELKTHAIIIATGAVPNRLDCPGEKEYWGKGITSCAVCDGAFYPDKEVVVVGGGDTAMEDASFLTRFAKKITIVQILDKLTASAALQKRVIGHEKINIIYNSTVTEIRGDNDHVTEVTITDQKTKETKNLKAEGLFIAIGLHPKTTYFEGQLELDKLGYLVIKNNTNTSVEGIFSAGDVSDYRYRQAITSAGSGCMAALDAQRYLETIEE